MSLGSKFIFIFNFSRTSPDPHLDETALLPCLATLMPILANNKAEAVEIFKVFLPSPPVPQVSIQSLTFTLFDFSLNTKTPPAISSETSPFLDKSVKKLNTALKEIIGKPSKKEKEEIEQAVKSKGRPKTPHRMSRVAFPKAKYGVYLAVIIIVIVLLLFYKDSIL